MNPSPHGKLNRRGFLKLSGAAAGAALAGPSLVSPARADHGLPAAPHWESRFGVCDMCFNRCSFIARVQDGVAVKLDPNPKFLKSRGMLCARGQAGLRQVYDPNRLKYPLLRDGARGEGKWKRLSWDEALDIAAQKMREVGEKYTRCGWLFMGGTDIQTGFMERLAEAYGSYNWINHESNCLLSGTRAFLDTFGEVPFPDLLNTKYVVMAGANRFEALVTPDSIDLMTALKNGAKLVVLDPRQTKTASLAHEWHPIRPGTDLAFMLAVCHVLIKEKLYDQDFVAQKVFGLEELAAHVQDRTPEWAETETQIPAADITRIARELAAAAPAAMIYPGRRSSFYANSTQIMRGYAMVNALLGNWDRPGGLTAARQVGLKGGVPMEAPWYDNNPDERADAHAVKMLFEEHGSFKYMRDAVISGDPYPIKGWMTFKTNPLQTGANRAKTRQMIERLDFMISVDIMMSDTAYLADLVLPSASAMERTDPCSALQGSSACACVVTRDPVIEPLYESKPMLWIMTELAKRLELGEFFDFDIEQWRAAQLADLPGALEALQKDGVYYNPSKLYGIYEGRIYKTKSHKIELYNQRYEEEGVDPMPVYQAPSQVPAGKLRLVVGRLATVTQSSSTNNSLLTQFVPENRLWLHPDTAQGMGVAEGDLVEVASEAGGARLKAHVTAETRPDTTYMHTGFGVLSPLQTNIFGKGAAIAEVLEDHADPLSGNMAMHETLVSVRKVEA